MPQKSALYGVARIRSAERFLIPRERMRKLAEMSAEDVLGQLVEGGYGALPDAKAADPEALIASELAKTNELVRDVSTEPEQTDIFFMQADVHNLKLLLKLRLTGGESDALMKGGCYDPKFLAKCVEDADYSRLPDIFKETLDAFEKEAKSGTVDPALLSTALDDAYIRYALQKGNDFVKTYFRAFADFTNIATLLRVRAIKGERARFASLLIEPGDVSKSSLLSAFELSDDALSKALPVGPAKEYMARGIETAVKTGRISAVERERDNYLIRLATDRKSETDTNGPVYGYLLAKRQEANVLRLILTAKRNDLPQEVIDERMRLLYGE